MDAVDLTPEQRTAQAQIDMLKTFKLVTVFVLGLMGLNTYTGIASTKVAGIYVKNETYQADKKEAKENRKEDKAEIKKILKAVQSIEGNLLYLKGVKDGTEEKKRRGK